MIHSRPFPSISPGSYLNWKRLAPVIFLGYFDSFLLAHPSVPANSATELIAMAKAKPNSVNWGHFGVANAVAPIRAGKLKALAVTADKRLADFPNVPTFNEEGIKLPLRGWYGYNMSAATPRSIVTRWNSEIRKVMAEQSYNDLLQKFGIDVRAGSPEDFDALVRTQLKEMGDLISYIDFKAE